MVCHGPGERRNKEKVGEERDGESEREISDYLTS